MSDNSNNPHLMPEVVNAVATLKSSTASQILDHIKTQLKASYGASNRPHNLLANFRRALRHGVDSGLLLECSGRYKLGRKPNNATPGINRKRKLQHLKDKKKYKRKRCASSSIRSAAEVESVSSRSSSASLSSVGTNGKSSNVDRSRRRRRRRRSRRRHGKRRRESLPDESKKSQDRSPVKKPPTPEPPSPQKPAECCGPSTSFSHRRRLKRASRPSMNRDATYDNECGNEDCLCNIKNNPREGSPDPGHNTPQIENNYIS